jgi:hypothetical protein
MGVEMVKFMQFEPCFVTRGVAVQRERRTARTAKNWDFIVSVSTLVVQWGRDWIVVTKRGVIKRGVIQRKGVIERGKYRVGRKIFKCYGVKRGHNPYSRVPGHTEEIYASELRSHSSSFFQREGRQAGEHPT